MYEVIIINIIKKPPGKRLHLPLHFFYLVVSNVLKGGLDVKSIESLVFHTLKVYDSDVTENVFD